MYEDEIYHYGKLGMKWGVRKSRPKSSGSRNRSVKKKKVNTAKKQKILTDARKQTLKKIAKTAAITAGSVAAAATLGTLGSVAFSTVMNNWNDSQRDLHNLFVPIENRNRMTNTTITNPSGNVSKEYMRELLSNSKKNRY